MEQRIAEWERTHGLEPRTVRLTSLETEASLSTSHNTPLPPVLEGITAAAQHMGALQEASLLVYGIEVLVELISLPAMTSAVCSSSNASRGRGPGVGSPPRQRPPNFHEVVCRARTSCEWASAKSRVAAALAATEGKGLEAFLDELYNKWSHPDIADAQTQMCTGSSDPADMPTPSSSRSEPGFGMGLPTVVPLVRAMVCSPDSVTPTFPGQANSFVPWSPRVTGYEQWSPEAMTQQNSMFCGARVEGSPSAPLQSVEGGISEWISRKPVILRSEYSMDGLSWDFPLSKGEKREYFLLNIIAESEESEEAYLSALRQSGNMVCPSTHSWSR